MYWVLLPRPGRFIDPEGTQSVLLLKPWTTVKAGVAEAMRRIGHRPQPLMRVFSSGFVTVIPRPDLCESHPDAGPFYGALGTDTPRDDNESRKLGSTLLMPGDTVYLTYLMASARNNAHQPPLLLGVC